jgi:polyhydroxyalkanoate synthesis regulator phasin
MMEDGIVVRRLTRATQRYGFIVPTGKMAADEARKYIQKVREDLKKRRLVTADGKVSIREAPIFQDEDFFIAQPDGEKADIKVLQGDGGLGDIGDIQHFLNKFFSGVKVPKAWLGFEADVNAKATLTEEAIAFARAARRVQLALRVGLHHIVDSRYMAQGIDPKILQYRILLPAMSTVDEMRDLEVQQLKAQIAKIYAVDIKCITNHVVLTQFMGLSDEEAYEIEQDQADQAQLEAQAQIAGQQQLMAAQSQQALAQNEEAVWRTWRVRQLTESARSLALWSLEHKAWERAADPADQTIVYLGE